jgi:hypothetical protein
MMTQQETRKEHSKYRHGASERLSALIDTCTSGSTAVAIRVWELRLLENAMRPKC